MSNPIENAFQQAVMNNVIDLTEADLVLNGEDRVQAAVDSMRTITNWLNTVQEPKSLHPSVLVLAGGLAYALAKLARDVEPDSDLGKLIELEELDSDIQKLIELLIKAVAVGRVNDELQLDLSFVNHLEELEADLGTQFWSRVLSD